MGEGKACHEHDLGLGLSVPDDSSARTRFWAGTVTRTEAKTRPTRCNSDYGGRTGARGRLGVVEAGASAKDTLNGVEDEAQNDDSTFTGVHNTHTHRAFKYALRPMLEGREGKLAEDAI